MIVIAVVCTLLGLFFQQELVKNYNPNDAFMNTVPRVISTLLLMCSGSLWTFYFIELLRGG